VGVFRLEIFCIYAIMYFLKFKYKYKMNKDNLIIVATIIIFVLGIYIVILDI